nr:Chain C, Membrane glycoprotein peptide [SARS coronavirus TJF]3I6K_G Chain G, Membrane glycoprotein peptide [SARS coronavirus TJF]
TLACFVLAAV